MTTSDPSQQSSQFKQPGDHIDRYEIRSVLGAGGMGVVYKAHDPELNRECALKLIKADCASGQLYMRFQQEAKALRDLKHPDIPEIYNFAVTTDGEPFMVIDFVEGTSLRSYLQEKKELSLEESMSIIKPLCNALKYAHDHGIIHRDIKPDNIILSFEKTEETSLSKDTKAKTKLNVKVIDFGLARLEQDMQKTQELTKTGNVLGSPKYMSPEQAKGQPANHQSDIYSIGCILFEMLVGTPPFKGNTSLETISLHVTKPVEDCLGSLPGKYQKDEILELFEKTLAKEAKQRFNDVEEISRSLEMLIRKEKEEKKAPLIEVEEFEQSSVSIGKIAITCLIGGLLIAGITFGTIKLWGLVSEYIEHTNRPLPKEDTSNKTVKHFFEDVGFEHRPAKGEGYYNAAHNVTDNDFADLVTRKPKARNVDSNKSDTITGDGIKYLRTLPVHRLKVVSKKLSNVALKNCGELKSLVELTVGGTSLINKEGFDYLHGLKELRVLCVEACQLQPGTIESIASLDKVFSLSLKESSPITDEDLIALSKMPELKTLAIDFTGVTASGLKYLKQFPKLRSFKAEAIGITDKEMPYLASLALQSLDISHNSISDKGMLLLKKNKALRALDIEQQYSQDDRLHENLLITEGAITELKKAIPGLTVRWKRPASDPCKSVLMSP